MDAIVAGYRVVRRLGSGEGSDVYLGATATGRGEAASTDPGALVVLKILRERMPAGSLDREVRARCLMPAGRVAALRDVASLPDGRVCLVLEYVRGPTLARLLAADRFLAPGEVVTSVAPVVTAITELCELGLALPDLASPSIRFDDRGRPRLGGLHRLVDLPGPGPARAELLAAAWASLVALARTVAERAPHGQARVFADRLAALPAPAAHDGAPSFTEGCVALERALFEWSPASPVRLGAPPDTGMAAGVTAGLLRPGLPPAVPAFVPPGAAVGRRRDRRGLLEAALDVRPVVVGRRWAAQVVARQGARLRGWASRIWRDRASRLRLDGASRGGPDGPSRGSRRGPVLAGVALAVILGTGGALALSVPAARPAAPLAPSGSSPTGRALQVGDQAAGDHMAGDQTPGDQVVGDQVVGDQVVGDQAVGDQVVGEGAADRAADQEVLAEDDPVAAASVLLRMRAQCLADVSLECLSAVDQPESPALALDSAAAGAARGPGEQAGQDAPGPPPAAPTLIDRIGDLALVAAPSGAGDATPASVLLVKGEAGWRVRAVFGD